MTLLLSDLPVTWLFVASLMTAVIVYFRLTSTSKVPQPLPPNDSRLSGHNAVLVILSSVEGTEDLSQNFHGTVITDIAQLPSLTNKNGSYLFFIGSQWI
jgi:hypothetical protein